MARPGDRSSPQFHLPENRKDNTPLAPGVECLTMDPVFLWVESSAFSIWTRESTSVFAFPTFLAVHAIGMALVAGMGAAINLRILGVAPGVPLTEMRRFFPLIWAGVWLCAASGTILLIAYPTKAFTNPFFYAKLIFVALGIVQLRVIGTRVLGDPSLDMTPVPGRGRLLAISSLVCWAGAIGTGRFLAYTYVRLLSI